MCVCTKLTRKRAAGRSRLVDPHVCRLIENKAEHRARDPAERQLVHVAYGRTSMGWAASYHQDERAEAFEADAEHGQRVVWNGAGPLAGSCSRLARLSRILQHGVMCVCGVVDVARAAGESEKGACGCGKGVGGKGVSGYREMKIEAHQ